MRALALLPLLLASPAAAVPLTLSATDYTWYFRRGTIEESWLSLRLEDLAAPEPNIGRVRMDLTGHVVHGCCGRDGSDTWIGENGVIAAIDAEHEFTVIEFTGAYSYQDNSGVYGPLFQVGEDYHTYPERLVTPLDWSAVVELTIDSAALPEEVTFSNLYTWYTCSTDPEIEYCDGGVRQSSDRFTVQFAPIPEPSTLVLVAMGLLYLRASIERRS